MTAKQANESVTEGNLTHTITHNLGSSSAVLRTAKTNWATVVYWTAKATNTITVAFTVPAPASALIDWVVEV